MHLGKQRELIYNSLVIIILLGVTHQMLTPPPPANCRFFIGLGLVKSPRFRPCDSSYLTGLRLTPHVIMVQSCWTKSVGGSTYTQF